MSPFIEEPVGLDVEELISQLTIDEKVSLLAGQIPGELLLSVLSIYRQRFLAHFSSSPSGDTLDPTIRRPQRCPGDTLL